jgi:hypothetical protein
MNAHIEALEALFGNVPQRTAPPSRRAKAYRPENPQKNAEVVKTIDAREAPIGKMLAGGDWQEVRS